MVDAHALPSDTSLEVIRRLIRFDTVSRHSNLPLIEWVADYLHGHGVRVRLSHDPDGGKANLFATIGEGDQGGVLLAGHTDTVPVDGQVWATDPFDAVVQGGRLYGRGAADMKSFIGVCLALVPQFQRARLGRPVHLALTFDEETSMLGARTLIADLRDAGIRPLGCVIGEPTELKAVVGHKGRRELRCCVRGKSAHSSIPMQGVNAIEYAARIIAHLRSMAERHLRHEERHYGYDVPYSTVLTTTIEGGLSANTVPAQCSFDFEFRHLPWTDPDALEAEVRTFAAQQVLLDMAKESADCAITFETRSSLPAFGAQTVAEGLDGGTSELLGLLGQRDGPLGYVGFGTEASWFQDAGIPTVVCGPGSIEQAHKPDEFIALSQIAACERLLLQLVQGGG